MKKLICTILMICISLMMVSCSSDTKKPSPNYDSTIESVCTTIPNSTTHASTALQTTKPTQTTKSILTTSQKTTKPSQSIIQTTKPTVTTHAEATKLIQKTTQTTKPIQTTSAKTTKPVQTTHQTTRPILTSLFLSNLSEVCDYLNAKKEANILKFSFNYIGSAELNAQLLARMTSAYYVSYTRTLDRYDIVITEYPGDRIVDAWKSNNTSNLSSAERQTLDEAVKMVNQAKAQASSDYELELILHDMLADHITYYDISHNVSSANDLQRHLTVIGALLDGKANCQGYTDAFYTLGSIAGLKVGRLSVETPEDLHITNTVCFDNIWYVLDVTFDDQDSSGVTNYRLFNAGKDVIYEYSWPDYMQYNPIASVSDNLFYYNHYGIVYTDVQTISTEIADEWATNGTKTIRGMLKNETDTSSFDKVFYEAMEKTGKPFDYTYWYYHNDHDTYYTVIFEY